MKLLKNKNIFILGILLTAFACEDFLGGDLNQDPNKPSKVPVSGILPQIQIALADTYGGSFSRWNSLLAQQVEGVARQWSSFNQYKITPNRFDAAWSDYFENVLIELSTVKSIAEENDYNHYLGIANVIEAFTIMSATDVWGDMPYSETVLGSDNFNPKFDDQETEIYPAILALLTEAKALFAKPSGLLVPGSDDLYYKGDIGKWTKAANGLLARYYLHLGNYSSALSSAQASFSDRSENLAYNYGAAPAAGPWYRFNDGRTGDIEFHPTMKKLMMGLNDSDRLAKFDVDFTTDDHEYFIAEFKQDLISYREIQFIIAEAGLKSSASGDVIRDAYLRGIAASFKEVGLEDDKYESYKGQSEVDPGAGNITENHIMTQKYIGLFVQPEAFSDWRRTGIPALTPVSGSKIPRRWDYSFNEYLFNSNAPEQKSDILFDRVDWDK